MTMMLAATTVPGVVAAKVRASKSASYHSIPECPGSLGRYIRFVNDVGLSGHHYGSHRRMAPPMVLSAQG